MRKKLFPMTAPAALALLALAGAPLLAAAEEGESVKPQVPAAAAPQPTADPADALPWPQARPIKKVTVGNAPIVSAFGKFVYFAGQPGPEDLAHFKAKGVKSVVNLRAPAEMKFDEKAEVEKLGLQYLQSPVGHAGAPSAEEFDKIAAVLDKAGKGEPVLLHCASSNRVGFVWALYRARRHGLSPDAALAEGKAAGLKAPPLIEVLRKELGMPAAPAAPALKASATQPVESKPAEGKSN